MKKLDNENPNKYGVRTKTNQILKKFLNNMKYCFEFIETDDTVNQEIEFRKHAYPEFPECKIVFRIEYGHRTWGTYEFRSSSHPDENGVFTIVIAFKDLDCQKKQCIDQLLEHIKESYQIDFAENYPTLHLEGHIIDFKCKPSQNLDNLITDIKETIPEVTVERIEEVIRFKMK